MPIKYEDPVTGEYFDTESEADFSGMLHREMYFNDDGGAAERARQEMEEELMEQERQRNLQERAWKQYQAKLKESKRWRELSREQQIKEIIDTTMAQGSYTPPTLFSTLLSGLFVVVIFDALIESSPKIEPLWSITMFLFFIVSLAITKNTLANYITAKKRDNELDNELIEEMKKIARETKSKALTIELPEPLGLEGSVVALRHYIYLAAKYGFEVTNPELQEFYKKNREELIRRKDTCDLDWESLWNEKTKETAA